MRRPACSPPISGQCRSKRGEIAASSPAGLSPCTLWAELGTVTTVPSRTSPSEHGGLAGGEQVAVGAAEDQGGAGDGPGVGGQRRDLGNQRGQALAGQAADLTSSSAWQDDRRITVTDLQAATDRSERWSMLTSCDVLTAGIFEQAGVRALLVGDAGAKLVLGHGSTLPVTMAELVRRGLESNLSELPVAMLRRSGLAASSPVILATPGATTLPSCDSSSARPPMMSRAC